MFQPVAYDVCCSTQVELTFRRCATRSIETFQITSELLVQRFISTLVCQVCPLLCGIYGILTEIANTMALPPAAPAFIIRVFNSRFYYA